MPGALTSLLIHDQQFGITAHDNFIATLVRHQSGIFKLDHTADAGLDVGLFGAALCGTADMESPHCQLCTGLAD